MGTSEPQSKQPLDDAAIDRAVKEAKKLYYVRVSPIRQRHIGSTTIKEDLKAIGAMIDCLALKLKQSHDVSSLPVTFGEFADLFPEVTASLLDHIVDEKTKTPRMTGENAQQQKEAYFHIAREVFLQTLGLTPAKTPSEPGHKQAR